MSFFLPSLVLGWGDFMLLFLLIFVPVKWLLYSDSGMRLSIHAPSLVLNLPGQPFGKDIANQGLFRALNLHGGLRSAPYRG